MLLVSPFITQPDYYLPQQNSGGYLPLLRSLPEGEADSVGHRNVSRWRWALYKTVLFEEVKQRCKLTFHQ